MPVGAAHGGVPYIRVRAQPRAQPLERDVGGAGEPGGRRARGGVRHGATGHRAPGRTPQLHARGHVWGDGQAARHSPGPGVRAADAHVQIERVHRAAGDQRRARHVPAAR